MGFFGVEKRCKFELRGLGATPPIKGGQGNQWRCGEFYKRRGGGGAFLLMNKKFPGSVLPQTSLKLFAGIFKI